MPTIESREPAVDRDLLKRAILYEKGPILRTIGERQGFSLGNITGFDVRAFETEEAGCVAVDYTMTFDVVYDDPTPALGRYEKASIKGSAFLFPDSGELRDHRVQAVRYLGPHASGGRCLEEAFPIPAPPDALFTDFR